MARRVWLIFLILVTLFSAVGPVCFASYFENSPWRDEATYNRRMMQKFGFGFANLVIGPFELFQEPYKSVQDEEMMWKGLGRGLVNGIIDCIGGALHMITFPVTALDIRLPEGGTDLVY